MGHNGRLNVKEVTVLPGLRKFPPIITDTEWNDLVDFFGGPTTNPRITAANVLTRTGGVGLDTLLLGDLLNITKLSNYPITSTDLVQTLADKTLQNCKVKDVATTPVGDLLLKVNQEILELRNASDTAFGKACFAGLFLKDLVPGAIPFTSADGLITHDALNLFWDVVTARLGLGTNNPLDRLHIAKGRIRLGAIDDVTAGGQIFFEAAGTHKYFYIRNFAGKMEIVTEDVSGESVKFVMTNEGAIGAKTSVLDPDFAGEFGGHVGPTGANVYDLGTSTLTWRDLYLAGTSHIGRRIRLYDADPTPVADRDIDVIDGMLKVRDLGGTEVRAISKDSIQQITDTEVALGANIAFSKLASTGLSLTQHGDLSGDALIKHSFAQINGAASKAQLPAETMYEDESNILQLPDPPSGAENPTNSPSLVYRGKRRSATDVVEVKDVETIALMETGGIFSWMVRLQGNDTFRLNETFSDGETALVIRRNVGGVFSMQPVSMGPADSGGTGFRLLRVPN